MCANAQLHENALSSYHHISGLSMQKNVQMRKNMEKCEEYQDRTDFCRFLHTFRGALLIFY